MSEVIRQTTKAATDTLLGKVFWRIIVGAILVCVLSGPFGTLDALPNGFRLIYWGLIVICTGVLGLWTHTLVRTQQWRKVPIVAGVAVCFGLSASALVVIISVALLNPLQDGAPSPLELFAYSFPSAALIFFLTIVLDPSNLGAKTTTTNARPALLKRLEKNAEARRVLALRAQDHYVEVTTEIGSELCLMRLNDAISETAPEEGMQIHRSHWVAISAIDALDVKGAFPCVRLIDGTELKVSQSRLKALESLLDTSEPD